jgi:hypothetical protein
VIDRAHELDQLLVDDLDDLVGRVDPFEHVLADGLGLNTGDEVVSDSEVDVGFEEGPADLAEAFADVVGGQPAAAAELAERILQTALDRIKHAEPTGRCAMVGDRILGWRTV